MLNILLVLYSIAADYKIYTRSTYESVQHLHCLQKETKRHIHYTKNILVDPIDVLTLAADVDRLVLWFPLLYLHG